MAVTSCTRSCMVQGSVGSVICAMNKPKMDSEKMQLFAALNHLDGSSGVNYICGNCNNWLTSEATKDDDDGYICQPCSSQRTNSKPLDCFAKIFFENLLYPCLNEQCDFIGKNDEILAHAKQCEHVLLDCHLCDKIELDANAFTDHYNTCHEETTLKVDDLRLTLSMEELKNEKFIVIYKHHVFLLYIKMTDDMIFVNVAKLFHNSNEDFSTTFTVSIKCVDVKQKFSKDMTSLPDIDNDADGVPIRVLNAKKIEIIFCKLKKVYELGECPICLCSIDVKLYQCPNGHNVCKDCGKKTTTCAICRISKLKLVNSQFLYPNILKRCKFSEFGCLFIGEKSDCMQHVNKCLYRTVECPECQRMINRNMLKSHILEVHENMLFNNGCSLYTTSITDDSNEQYYTYFNHELFVCSIGMTGESEYGFSVAMALNLDLEEAEKYSFEIQILNKDLNAKVVHSLRGICQVKNTTDYVMLIGCELFKKYLSEEDGESTLYYKFIITKRA